MIKELATDLLTRVRGVPTLEQSTSFAIGGKAADPALKTIPLPFCRLLFMNVYPAEDPITTGTARGSSIVPTSEVVLLDFRALLGVPYLDDTDILTVELPLLESVKSAVHGIGSPSGHRWRWFSTKLSFVYPDRLGYELMFTVNAVL